MATMVASPSVVQVTAGTVLDSSFLSQQDLKEARKAQTEFERIKAEFSAATKTYDAWRSRLICVLAGVKKVDEIRLLTKQQLEMRIKRRRKNKAFRIEAGSLDVALGEPTTNRSPAWKQEFIRLTNEAEADAVSAQYPLTYCHDMVVTQGKK